MRTLNKNKLSVKFKPCITATEPILYRRYTLTHSDKTGELFLVIGLNYAYENISPMRDEVLAEWRRRNNGFAFKVYLHVDGRFGFINAIIRNRIFKKELPLALEAIRYGDRGLFEAHPELRDAPVVVFFSSKYPWLNKVENWGPISKYNVN